MKGENKMTKYLFNPFVTMKEYNRKNWWIDRDIIPHMYIMAENVKDALRIFKEKTDTIDISENAIKNPEPMFMEDNDGNVVQTGYVITGKSDCFRDDKNNKWSTQYVDIWLEIQIVNVPEEFIAEEGK